MLAAPPPLPNRGHHVGPAGSFPGHLGPAHSAKGSAQAAGLLRLPRVPVTPARGWEGPVDQSRGGGGGGEAGGSGGSPGSWLSRLPSAPPGEAVVRLTVAVVTLAGNQHLICLETGPESALWESGTSGPGGEPVRPPFVAPDPNLASVSPWQGAPSAEGPQTLTRPRCPCGTGRRAWRGPKPRLGLSVSTARGAERGGAPNPVSASVSPW